MSIPEQGEFANIEIELLDLINQYRSSEGLSELGVNELVNELAREHSEDMASGKLGLGHEGFEERLEKIETEVRYVLAGENVAFSGTPSNPAQSALDAWLDSPPHKENIEGDYDLTGIGIARSEEGFYYYTQIFLKQ